MARSVLIAIAASYAALDLAGRVTAARGRARASWLAGGAIAMGIGIWEMHFKGLLAFHLPVPVAYHWPTVLASFVVAACASAVALRIVSQQRMGPVQVWTGGLIMGGGIAALHYIDMASMRLAAVCRFDLRIVILSVVFAIVFSFLALIVAFGLREETRGTLWRRIGSALVMGAAISMMHYTGMASATFIASPVAPDLSRAVSISPLVNSGVAIITFLVLGAALMTSSADRRRCEEIQRLNQELEGRVAERTRQLEAVNRALRKEIVERQQAEEAVRQSKDHLRLVIDTAPAMLHSARPDGYLDFFNKRWLEYLGVSLDDLLGWRWTSVIHPDDLAQLVDRWQTSLATGKPFEAEARLRRADGEYRLTLHRKVPLRDEAGNIVKWYGSVIDIEDRRRAEEALQEAQDKLAHVTRLVAMGELAAAIAHEVNQPLAAIVTNANFCLRQFASATPNSDQLREAISEIANDGTRASAIISRIRALLQKDTPERVPVDMNQVIREVIMLVRGELTRNRISMRADLGLNLPPVSGDRVQLQQVVINLVMNGIEAMRSLAGRPRELLIKSAGNHNEVLIQVQDSGEGFDPQQREQMFEPFFTTKPDGIGMGLAIGRSIVESHGGRLWAESDLKGAVFQMTLPVQK